MMGSQGNVRKEDVVQKLKDDGDFDRLRLMIIRKLKDKEQFCDAIYKEIQTEAMNHISDSLWEIISNSHGEQKGEQQQPMPSERGPIKNLATLSSSLHGAATPVTRTLFRRRMIRFWWRRGQQDGEQTQSGYCNGLDCGGAIGSGSSAQRVCLRIKYNLVCKDCHATIE
ncbi:hypothetical protein PVL29_004772 [Vitis rotundifolia]|uniref:Uncharacterized protein n=1 Tax=Vitis rotundifolia TaxID=103349 RepID=A0AA39E1F5_VITRO|nr:hypothetical protein PVL29_004772 [Vitis rotundifolia]